MPWHVAKVHGYEHSAWFDLRRRGIECFYPVDHDYGHKKVKKKGDFIIVPRWPGYVFVELHNGDDRALALSAKHVTGLLGSWDETGYQLAEIPRRYMIDLMEARIRKLHVKGAATYNKDQKVTLALNAITKITAKFKDVIDGGRKAVVSVETLGSSYDVTVDIARLEAAE